MKGKLALWALLCLVAVTALALSVAPTASAKAKVMTVTGSEAYAAQPNLVAERVVGYVAYLTFENVLSETSANPMGDGLNYTRMYVVALLAEGSYWASTRGICYGSFRLVTETAGTWRGTFAGTISMAGGTYDIRVVGAGVSGDVKGMLLLLHDVNTLGYGFPADWTGTIIAPHGL